MVCSQGPCSCGRPIIFRVINGRVTPIHVRK
jgi:hypothetical protein